MARDVASHRLPPQSYCDGFADLHAPLTQRDAKIEASRCYFCHDAPCITACPTSIDIPMFIRQIQTDNPAGAAETIFAENILGGICARVCPTETLCEEACVRNDAEAAPVKIGQLQRYATDHLMEKGTQPFERGAETGKKIAVVGAGPAGLSCAHRLSMHGHTVEILEAKPKSGGLNEYGIAAYKAPDNFAQAEVDYVLSIGGITVKHGVKLGTDVSLADLREQYDAVFLGLGKGAAHGLGLAGEEADGVLDAIDTIADIRQAQDKAEVPVGSRIVVIGGGMTAIDVAVQTKRLGAEDVTIAYRRGAEQMGASEYECELALTNGVKILHWVKPAALVTDGGEIQAIELEKTALSDTGKLEGTGETISLPADMVFKAIGQKFIADDVADQGLALEHGQIAVDAEQKTSLADVWAGGDCVAGGLDLTVESVEHGKIAAESINAFLSKGE